MRTIVVGSRQSALALTQTGQVVDRLKAELESMGIECQIEIKKIVTKGDRILDVTLSKVGGKGLFVKEIEQAMLDGEIDIAVHSMKDMPSELPDGLTIGAVPEREDPRDCLVAAGGVKLDDLPAGARIGTSSLRRTSQLKAYRGDLSIEFMRGNIDSRLRKLETEGFDAIMLAAAGLHRMGWGDRITQYVDTDICLPNVGQGALGIQCRADNDWIREVLARIHHEPTARAVTAERSFMARLDGGCHTPMGAYARELADGRLKLEGMVGSPDGSRIIRESVEGGDPAQLGILLAERLLEQGADVILEQARRAGEA
ncbi:hydroxymethylbilane synthase [Paenibacillus thermoaerophilus]|uniref:Porphobilinogen deaminase n=1 Tax=Paenibacillus thermoaerophilus TaxID=1215385 RepID=A0ABW2V5I5_9BACL|nr:hydroxymethylbilane synthase [Paenibacillus thermoaerophilus]TMV11089.1 hydroxymethylbilane synthase [Paenibacillus thermoaerophilus]